LWCCSKGDHPKDYLAKFGNNKICLSKNTKHHFTFLFHFFSIFFWKIREFATLYYLSNIFHKIAKNCQFLCVSSIKWFWFLWPNCHATSYCCKFVNNWHVSLNIFTTIQNSSQLLSHQIDRSLILEVTNCLIINKK
jgi:hypothetical protein